MIDMVTKLGAVVVFSTESDDYIARVVGPQPKDNLRTGEAVPTGQPGPYTVVVVDRRIRHVKARLKASDPTTSQPPEVPHEHDEMVTISYRVQP